MHLIATMCLQSRTLRRWNCIQYCSLSKIHYFCWLHICTKNNELL